MSLIQIKGEELKEQIQNLMLEDEKHEVKSFGCRTMFLNSRDDAWCVAAKELSTYERI
jgi:CO dehydrogenase/acetyl-CoA synthase beta subunit